MEQETANLHPLLDEMDEVDKLLAGSAEKGQMRKQKEMDRKEIMKNIKTKEELFEELLN